MSIQVTDEARHHAINLEQCSILVESAPVARAMTDAAKFLRALAAQPSSTSEKSAKLIEKLKFHGERARQEAADEGCTAMARMLWARKAEEYEDAVKALSFVAAAIAKEAK